MNEMMGRVGQCTKFLDTGSAWRGCRHSTLSDTQLQCGDRVQSRSSAATGVRTVMPIEPPRRQYQVLDFHHRKPLSVASLPRLERDGGIGRGDAGVLKARHEMRNPARRQVFDGRIDDLDFDILPGVVAQHHP